MVTSDGAIDAAVSGVACCFKGRRKEKYEHASPDRARETERDTDREEQGIIHQTAASCFKRTPVGYYIFYHFL